MSAPTVERAVERVLSRSTNSSTACRSGCRRRRLRFRYPMRPIAPPPKRSHRCTSSALGSAAARSAGTARPEAPGSPRRRASTITMRKDDREDRSRDEEMRHAYLVVTTTFAPGWTFCVPSTITRSPALRPDLHDEACSYSGPSVTERSTDLALVVHDVDAVDALRFVIAVCGTSRASVTALDDDANADEAARTKESVGIREAVPRR